MIKAFGDGLSKSTKGGGKMIEKSKSKAVFLYDVTNNSVVFEKNSDMRLPFASIVKVVTVILSMEKCSDINHTLIEMEESVLNQVLPLGPSLSALSFYPGKRFPVLDFIYSSIVSSGCEAARQLAFYVGDGDMSAYLDQASRFLRKLGCKDTKIIEPTGLEDEGQYSTARDITRIFIYAMKNPLFARGVSTFWYKSPYYPQIVDTTNVLMRPDCSDFNAYAIGGKTGTNDEAGRCLVCAFERKEKRYILVTLGYPFINTVENKKQFYKEEINPLIFSAFNEDGDFAKVELPFHLKRVKAKDEFKLDPIISCKKSDCETRVSYVSENEEIATVDENGLVKVHAPGFTQIEVITDSGDYDICYVDSRGMDAEIRRIRTPLRKNEREA